MVSQQKIGHERLDGGPDRRLAENREPGRNKDGTPDRRFERRASALTSDPNPPRYSRLGKIEMINNQAEEEEAEETSSRSSKSR